MPELPEVETTIRGLKKIKNQKVYSVQAHTNNLRFKIPKGIKKVLVNTKISNIRRIAKYIILDLNNNYSLIFHLGMSGRLKISNDRYSRIKHDHFIINFANKATLIYNDARKFGFIDISNTKKINNKKYILTLGIDALNKKLNHDYLYTKIFKSEVPIKQILLNQKIISGIGNIYASEILFNSKISPLILGKDLKNFQIVRLIKSIRIILRKAINSGGSSIRDYRSADGTLGNFQSNFKVYGKDGENIGKNKIIKIVQYGRSTFYCPEIQNNN